MFMYYMPTYYNYKNNATYANCLKNNIIEELDIVTIVTNISLVKLFKFLVCCIIIFCISVLVNKDDY